MGNATSHSLDGVWNKITEPARYQLTNDRAVALYQTLGCHLADATTGGLLFWLGISAAQVGLYGIRVGAATPIVPRVIGTVAVSASSIFALHFASLPREIYEEVVLHVPVLSSGNSIKRATTSINERISDLSNAPFGVYMVMGVLCFKMLGGRMNAIAPSHYANLGAFHLKKASLPATEEYGSAIEKNTIREFGRLFGCHTCGVKRGVQYHADHMPPKKFALERNKSWVRKLTRQEVTFRFYPQCSPCSNKQASDVKMNRGSLKLHLMSFRLYHTTGLWLVLLCTGGLYVGGSKFHEMSDVSPQSLNEQDPLSRETTSTSLCSSDQGFLRSLRDREKRLRKLKQTMSDAKRIQDINLELQSIAQCKERLKTNVKNTKNTWYINGHKMATTDREQVAKTLLNMKVASKPVGIRQNPLQGRPGRHRQLPSPSKETLEFLENGWNNRFSHETRPEPKRSAPKLVTEKDATNENSPQKLKEKKIREERQQYGNVHHLIKHPTEHSRANGGRLVPLVPLADPPKEPQQSTKEEGLRFKVLKAIDARETLLYQLNALILCTPVQEAFLAQGPRPVDKGIESVPSLKPRAKMALAHKEGAQSTGAMTNSREATKLALKLAAELQLTGIQCVEALVEWMLEAGAKAEKPPVFLWRGRNYFLKMVHDLDFADTELRARGVILDCFSIQNPLCIRPDQRLGRVLAAQSIIHEMTQLDKEMTQGKASGRQSKRSEREKKVQKSARTPRANEPKKSTRTPRGNATIALSSGRPHAPETAPRLVTSAEENPYQDDDEFHDAIKLPLPAVDSLSTSRIDENPYQDDDEFGTTSPEVEHGPLDVHDHVDTRNERTSSPMVDDLPGPTAATAGPTQQLTSSNVNMDNVAEVIEDDSPIPAVAVNSLQLQTSETSTDWWKILEQQLLDHAHSFQSSPSHLPSLQQCKDWVGSPSIRELEDINHAMNNSVLFALHSYCFEPGSTSLVAPIEHVLASEAAQRLSLTSRIWNESVMVVDELCSRIADSIRKALVVNNSLVSEMEIGDIVEAAEVTLGKIVRGSIKQWLECAIAWLQVLHHLDTARELRSHLTDVVKVFYPYLVNQPRDTLVRSWHRITSVLDTAGSLPVHTLSFLLDETCKCLILNITYLRRVQSEDGDLSEDEDHTNAIPKFSFVCERLDILGSTVAAVAPKCLTSRSSSLPPFVLFPFFRSSFGEKRVDGIAVEEGEGKGPLKEWFTLVAAELSSKWRQFPTPPLTSGAQVSVTNNKLVIQGLEMTLKQGMLVQWTSGTNGETITRTINHVHGSDSYLLDRIAPSETFPGDRLRVMESIHPALEYIKASESYWLCGQTPDTMEHRQLFRFVGWFVANALLHHCALNVRFHTLLFELLLNEHRKLQLEDIAVLDPSLHSSLIQMRVMKAAEFKSYLEFEGFSPSLSVQEYIQHSIDEKFGSKSNFYWQMSELRRGFHSVFSSSDLTSTCISGSDIQCLLWSEHGSLGDSKGDFNLEQVFRVSVDPDFANCEPFKQVFWSTVQGFTPNFKRKLVKFITGVETLPQEGTEFLRIEMPFASITAADHEKTLKMLPQSHTCDNTLELPHYWRSLCWKAKHNESARNPLLESELAVLLTTKLQQAAEYSEGYGLDGTNVSIPSALAGMLHQKDTSEIAAQESYESLDLPALGDNEPSDVIAKQLVPDNTHMKSGQNKSGGDDEAEYIADDWEEE